MVLFIEGSVVCCYELDLAPVRMPPPHLSAPIFFQRMFVAWSPETKTMPLNVNFKLSIFKTIPNTTVIFQQHSKPQDAHSSAALMLD